MKPTDAFSLINMYPEINTVAVRRGYDEHATGVGSGNVDTVVEYFDGTTRRLLAASPTNIYNATTAGSASSLAGSFNSGRWQTAIQDGVMGLVNGADAPQTFDGSSIASMTISGVGTASELIGIHVFKSRSYFWKEGSPSFWYSAVNTLGGACTEFNLGEIARFGGNLTTMTSWTVDGGDGVDDFAVFIMSSGEVLVYQGSDPGSSSDWALVGSYRIPPPLDIRGAQRIGGEVAVLTENDLVFLPSSFNKASPPSSKLRGAIELAGPTYRANTGWQLIYYPIRSMLVANVPISTTQFEQYVMNTETGAPARFIEQNGRAWGVYNNELYFGATDGRVLKADSGTDDDGERIDFDCKQAWNDLGVANEKQVSAYRLVLSGTANLKVGGKIAYDYINKDPDRIVTAGSSGVPWGSPWGTPWGSETGIQKRWKTASGSGTVFSVQIAGSVSGERPEWYRTDMVVKQSPNI